MIRSTDDLPGGSSMWSLPGWMVTLLLVAVPLACYLSLIGSWSLDRDEYHTLVDSSKPLSELLSYDIRPLYYLILHPLLKAGLPWSREFTMRLPAALFASLVPAVFFEFLRRSPSPRIAPYAALLALVSPWTFELSQYARYYSLMLLAASIATLAIYRWWEERHWRWLALFLGAAFAATISHTTAASLFPATIVAVALALGREDPRRTLMLLRRYGIPGALVAALGLIGGGLVIRNQFLFWLSKDAGQYGGYSVPQLYLGLCLGGGASAWILAVVPWLLGRDRQASTLLLVALVVMALLPVTLLALIGRGGGVAVRYLMCCLPAVWILAARQWHLLATNLPRFEQRCVVTLMIISVNVPFLLSTLQDGDHYDYRSAAAFIDGRLKSPALVLGSSPNTLEIYLRTPIQVVELPEIGSLAFRDVVGQSIQRAASEGRSLLMLVKLDRFALSAGDQDWLSDRFAVLRVFEKPRYDYRRNRLVVYQHRPSSEAPGAGPQGSDEAPVP